MPQNKLSIFIFRRDHRLYGNTGLLQALSSSEQVFPCFIFDTAQIDPIQNPYFSNNCVQFMIESLKDLYTQLQEHNSRLYFFHGEIEATVKHILETVKPDALFLNEDITPYSIQRDEKVKRLCNTFSIKFFSYQDVMINAKEKVLMPDGSYFKVFTPYQREAMKYTVREPMKNPFNNYFPGNIEIEGEHPFDQIDNFYVLNPDLEVRGGRLNALKILENMKAFKDYNRVRSIPTIPTTKLSAYNKFGCVSIREVYTVVKAVLGKDCKLMTELYWRDFYYYLTYHDPRILKESMKPEYINIKFEHNDRFFQKWKEGNTGCPVVDAGMRHMNKTGYMPNRLRMTVANYLTKDLLLSYRLGEQYFAQTLVDYDPCQNNGGWQWSAGTGPDYKEFLRIFNPVLQSQKFDKDCEYILTWIPGLKDIRKDHIHNWETCYMFHKGKNINYADPLINHAVQRKKCIEMYRNATVRDQGNTLLTENTLMDEEEKENNHINTNAEDLDHGDGVNELHQNRRRKASAPFPEGNPTTKIIKRNVERAIPNKTPQKLITNWFKKSPNMTDS